MYLGCKIDLTQKRTKELWQYYLTYMDSTPSILPEPKPISYENILSVVSTDWNNDGFIDRAILILSKDDPSKVELYIYLSDSTSHSMKLSVHKKNIAWSGALWGTIPTLEINKRGSLIITSLNDSIGRNRWSKKLTLSYRNNKFIVAGYTYVARDTLDLDYGLNCDVNLLLGHGIKNDKVFKIEGKEITISKWSHRNIPKECKEL